MLTKKQKKLPMALQKAIIELQEKKLREQMVYLSKNSPFYQQKFSQAGIEFSSIKTLKDLDSGLLDGISLPPNRLNWLSEKDISFYVEEFNKSGFRGPLNRYRCIDLDWKELSHLSNKKIDKPSCFITGDLDPVNFMVLNGLKSSQPNKSDEDLYINHINNNYNDLRELKIIKGCGHWTQQEKPNEVNKILLDFLNKI